MNLGELDPISRVQTKARVPGHRVQGKNIVVERSDPKQHGAVLARYFERGSMGAATHSALVMNFDTIKLVLRASITCSNRVLVFVICALRRVRGLSAQAPTVFGLPCMGDRRPMLMYLAAIAIGVFLRR